MEINLSEEMIEKIACVANGRINDLKSKEKLIKDSMAVGETQIRRKHMQLKDIEKAKADAEEVHDLFLELLEESDTRKIYKAEYADGEMEVFSYCDNDREAMEEAESYEKDHGTLFNLFEVDENYDEIRTVF